MKEIILEIYYTLSTSDQKNGVLLNIVEPTKQ